MKVHRVIIKKFRSIEKADIWIDSINAIVGQNNVGKSSLLRAINTFFNYSDEKEFFQSEVHSFGPRSSAKIELHFDDIDKRKFDGKFIENDKLIVEVSISKKGDGYSRSVKFKKDGKWIADSSVINKIKDQLDFILIPPNRDAKALDLVEHNILKKLVEEKMNKATLSRDNYTAKFIAAIRYLENHALKNIATETNKEFPIKNILDLSFKYKKEISYKEYLDDISIEIGENGQTHPLIECGSGIQSLTIIALYNLLSKEKEKNIIIGLEEPETNLHPQAQKELIEYFKKLVRNGKLLQFIFTTHSTAIVDQVDHTDIVLFRKKYNANRGFISELTRLSKNFYAKYNIEEFRYYQFHKYRNSEFFFSSFIVVTESKNEVEVIRAMGDKINIDFQRNGLTFLNLEGVDKAKYTVFLLKELQIPYILIIDKDFIVDYENGKYLSSLDNKGFPKYQNSFKNQEIINILISNEADSSKLLKEINVSYRRSLEILLKYKIIMMNYSLDLDLVNVTLAQQKYYDLLRIPDEERVVRSLTEKRNGIKKIKRILLYA